ncbi:MAG TPA: hypothetical protein VF645_03100 [Allosphingosinicella sp.]|jgi:hypothetical protein
MDFRVTAMIIIATTSCSQGNMTSERGARRTSDQFISEKYSINDISILKVTKIETPNNWTFIYEAPSENWAGGPLLVTVDKKMGNIVDHRGYQ